jgi:hypothetical protein
VSTDEISIKNGERNRESGGKMGLIKYREEVKSIAEYWLCRYALCWNAVLAYRSATATLHDLVEY